MRKLVTLFFILLIMLSCSDRKKVPKEILPPSKMQEVLWDMISAGEFLNGYVLLRDSSVDKMAEASKKYGQVLQFHHLTREEFDKSYLYYRQHPELMKVMLDSLSTRQVSPEEIYQSKADSVKADTTAKTDSLKRLDKEKAFAPFNRLHMEKRDSLKKRMRKKLVAP